MDFDALLREHRREVFSVCRAMVQDREVADELAQDALARAFAARGTFRGEASGRTWLLTIARNSCRDHLRRLRGSPFVDDPDTDEQGPQDDSPLPPHLLSNQREVRLALEALPEAWRAMVVLRFVHGFSYEELSSTFGIAPGAARMRVSRSLATMRQALQPPTPPLSRRRAQRSMEPRSMALPPAPGAAAPGAAPRAAAAAPAPPPTFAQVLAGLF